MKRPDFNDLKYSSRQPPLPDYEQFFKYVTDLEEYCTYLEQKKEKEKEK